MQLLLPGTPAEVKEKRWKSPPGGFDRLNRFRLFGARNGLDIPSLFLDDVAVPDVLLPANEPKLWRPGSAVHMFLDDYRLERVWSGPSGYVERFRAAGVSVCTPDFSLWLGDPLPMQLWNVYRNRWCGCFFQAHGVPVIPTPGWSDDRSFGFCFEGIPRGSVVAVEARTSRDAPHLFLRGFEEMLRQLEPSLVLFYGEPGVSLPEWPVRFYESFTIERRKRWAREAEEARAAAEAARNWPVDSTLATKST